MEKKLNRQEKEMVTRVGKMFQEDAIACATTRRYERLLVFGHTTSSSVVQNSS